MRRFGRALAAAALAAAFQAEEAAAQAAAPAPAVRSGLGAELDEYFTRLEAFGFSGAVLVAGESEIHLWKGYGWADLERRVPVTGETAFGVASITKQFTASAVLRLQEMGRLSVTDSLGRFFAAVPADKRGITLHHLLTHTSGLESPSSEHEEARPGETRDEWVQRLFAVPLAFSPGSRDEYSNAGFSLAAAVVEVASGVPYEQFVREHLLLPAGMAATGFSGAPAAWSPDQVALGYGVERGGDPRSRPSSWGDRGAGGVITTLGDLYRWEQALRGASVLSSRSVSSLFARQAQTSTFYDYGYGWRVQRTRWGTPLYWASGFNEFGNAMFWRLPQENLVMLFASNFSYDSYPLRDALVIPSYRGAVEPIVTGRDYTLPPWFLDHSPRPLQAYVGTYLLADGGRLDVEEHDRALRILPRTQTAAAAFLPALVDSIPAAYDTMNARAFRLIEALRAGGLAALPAAGDWVSRPITDRASARATVDSLRPLGPIQQVVWSVTLPVQGGRATTYMRVRSAHGESDLRLYWSDGTVYHLEPGLPLSVLPPFRPQSATEFVSYHIPLGRALRVRFQFSETGIATGLFLRGREGEIRAERQPDR